MDMGPVQLGVVNNNWRTTFKKKVAEGFFLVRKENLFE